MRAGASTSGFEAAATVLGSDFGSGVLVFAATSSCAGSAVDRVRLHRLLVLEVRSVAGLGCSLGSGAALLDSAASAGLAA